MVGCNLLVCSWLQELNLTQSISLGRQMEVQILFAPAANISQGGQQPFSVGVQLSTGQGTSTSIIVNGTAAATTNGSLQVAQVLAKGIMFLSSLETLPVVPLAADACLCCPVVHCKVAPAEALPHGIQVSSKWL